MDMMMFGTPDEEGSQTSLQGASSSAGAAGRSLKKSSSTNSSGRGKRRSSPSSFVKMMEGNGGCHWLMANEGEEEFGYSDYAVADRELFALEDDDDEQEGASAAAARTAMMFQQQQQCQLHQRPPPSKRLKVLTELAACEERLDDEEEEEGRGKGGEKVVGEEEGDGTTALLASVEAEQKEGEGPDDEEMCSLLAAPADPLLIYPPPLDLDAPPRCQTPCCNVSTPSPISCYLDGHLPKAPVAARHTMQHYGPEHFQKMREVELMVYQPDPQYEDQQKEFRPDMRAQLIDWLMEVSANFLVHRRTFQIAVNYIDRFLSIDKNQGYSPNKLQLLGVTSLLVASKVEEIYPPKAKELAITTAGASTAKEILKMEHELMQALSWRLSPPTVDDWAGWYLMKLSEHVATSQLPPTLYRSLHIVLDLSLLDVTSLHFFPSMLAAAALYNALPPHLHPALEAYTGYSIYNNDIKKCQGYLEFLHTTFNEDVSLLPAVSPRCIRARKEVPCWDRHNMQTHHPGLLSHLLERMDALADIPEPPPFITHRSVSGVSNMTDSSDSEGEEEEGDYDDDYLMEEEDDEEASLAASSATGELNHYRHVRQQQHPGGEEEEGVDSSGSDCDSLFQYCGFAGLMDEDKEEYDQEETTQLMTMEEPHHHQQQQPRPSSRASDFTCTSSSAMSQGEGDGPLALRDLATEELFWEIAGVVTTREDSVWSASFPTAEEEEEVEHEEEEEEGEEEEEYCGKKGERGGKPIAVVQQQRPYHRSKKGATEEAFYGKEAILSSSCSSSLGTSVTASLASSSSSSSCWSSAAAAAATVTVGAVDPGLSCQQASSTMLTKVLEVKQRMDWERDLAVYGQKEEGGTAAAGASRGREITNTATV